MKLVTFQTYSALPFFPSPKTMKQTLNEFLFFSTRHHTRRSPSTGCHTHASHSHASTPGSSPLHGSNAVAGLLSPHRTPPTSHLGQTGSPHRLSTVTTAAGNGNTTTPPVVAPVAALPNVGIEINDVQQGEFIYLILSFILFPINFKFQVSNCFIVLKKIFYPRMRELNMVIKFVSWETIMKMEQCR